MNIDECIEKGLLADTVPDLEKAKASLEMAERKLGLAEKEFEHKIFENAIISAYTSMFHVARALLFRDGYKERSHYALYVFIKEKYSDSIEKKYLNELNSLRLQRHELMYGLEKSEEAQENEAESAIENAKGFLETVGKIIEENNSKV